MVWEPLGSTAAVSYTHILFMGKEETHVVYIKPRIYSSCKWNLKSMIIVSPDLIVKEKRKNNIAIETVTCTHLFLPASWGSAHGVVPPGLRAGSSLGSGMGRCYCGLPASAVLHWEEYDVHVDDGLFFFTPESTWDWFCVFVNMLLCLCSFFTGLQLRSTSKVPYVVPFMYLRYSFFVLFVTLKTKSAFL